MDPFLAQIVMFGGNFAPRGWAFCDGQLLPIAQYQALFSLLGTNYGGDGRTTFALPDLRGRVPIHKGDGDGPGLSNYRLGQKGGVETVTLNTMEIPSHNHTAVGKMQTGPDVDLTDNSAGHLLAHQARNGNDALDIYTSGAGSQYMKEEGVAVTVGNTGGNMPHENRQPFLTVNYIIALQGMFPSRS